MSGIRSKLSKRKDAKLLGDSGDEDGVENPVMEQEMSATSGAESSPELEAAEADALVKTLKTKRTRKKKELAKDLVSPKDDLARELKEDKRKIREKINETTRLEEEETRRSLEVADDGTLPMPEEEEGGEPAEGEVSEREPTSPKEEGEEESPIKKLRRKKEKVEETPIEEAPVAPPQEEEKPAEAPPPTTEEAELETSRKTPRMASLRMKMKDRLAKAKEEAVSEVKEKAKESRREKRLQKDKVQTTRFDAEIPKSKYDEMEAEELERLAESRRLQREERKKKFEAVKKEGVYMPTAEEAFDFFTRIWEPEEEEEEKAAVEKAETEVKEKKEGEEEEEEKPDEEKAEGEEGEEGEPKPGKADDEQPLIPPEVEESYGLTVMRRAEFPDQDELIKKEEQIYFYPSVATIPATDKVEKDLEVRRLEEEGFYVGTRPSTSGWNQNRMEHRLLKEVQSGRESTRQWFGEDGKLLALPDPLRSLPSRPPVTEEEEPYLQTVFKKALIREFNNRYIDGTTEGGGQYQLDVDINQIQFSHHHLYSREHVLAARLTQLYEQYVIRQKKNMTQYLGEKLKALKNSALHLQDHIAAHRSEHSLADRSNYDRRLQDYKYEIRQSRMMRDREELADRQLLKNIIHTWKEIKTHRDHQTFNNTPVKLQVRKEEVDKEEDSVLWKQEIEDEMEELRDEHDREYKHKMLTYEEEMAKYHKQQQGKKEAESRRRKKKGRRGSKQSRGSAASASASEEITEDQLQKDEEILAEADLPQPEPPSQWDESALRDTVKAKAMEQRRRPGEPKLHLELSNTASITPTANCPPAEQRRRNDVSKCKVYVKVLFNNKEVCRTAAKPISQDFKVNYGHIYNLKIVQWPESIKFQVFESIGLGSHLMAELFAPIPDTSVTTASVQIEELDFSSDHRVDHSHEGVGSGLPFTFGKNSEEVLILMTTGLLSFSVAWALDEHGIALVPPTANTNVNNLFNQMKKMDPVAAIGASGVMDLKKLADWFASSRLDPNDPQNSDIVYMLRGRSGDSLSQLTPAEYFRLEQLMAEFDFVDDEDLAENRRFQLLQLRDEEVQEFRNYKMVPVHDREIPRDTFTEYERKKREEQKLKRLDDVDIESHRAAVKRFRQKIREQVMRRFRIQAHMKRWDDMVYEEAVPNIAMLGTNLLKLTERRAPLKPKRKERKKVTAQNIKGDEVKILVNITRAQNIPIRMSGAMHEMLRRLIFATQESHLDIPVMHRVLHYFGEKYQQHVHRGEVPSPIEPLERKSRMYMPSLEPPESEPSETSVTEESSVSSEMSDLPKKFQKRMQEIMTFIEELRENQEKMRSPMYRDYVELNIQEHREYLMKYISGSRASTANDRMERRVRMMLHWLEEMASMVAEITEGYRRRAVPAADTPPPLSARLRSTRSQPSRDTMRSQRRRSTNSHAQLGDRTRIQELSGLDRSSERLMDVYDITNNALDTNGNSNNNATSSDYDTYTDDQVSETTAEVAEESPGTAPSEGTTSEMEESEIEVLEGCQSIMQQEVLTDEQVEMEQERLYGLLHEIWQGTMATARATEGGRKKDQSLVRPFIEIMFQHQTIRTSTCDGPNPSFNEELEIPFKAPHDDYSPSNLQTVNDCIFLNLFDEVVVDIQQDDREKGTTLHQRIEKKWLGSLKIPFTTVYFNGKIDGTFAVDAPPVLLGYMHDLGPVGDVDIGIDKDLKTLLGLFITIEPPLTQPEPTKERFSTNEDEKLMVYADTWMTEIQARFTPKREVKTFVTDTNFKSVFITRYFRPIKPPDELGKTGEAQAKLLARYVSLIPFVSDSMIFPGLCDIWNTCDQFLQMLSEDEEEHAILLVNFFLSVGKKAWLICGTAIPEGPTAYVLSQFLQMLSGDEEEHAILLVNFFLSIGKKAWLICGTAIPEGPTAYVLSEEASGYWIWNPSSGEHYRTQDVNCPLQSIGCLVNHENIWANIQVYDKPSQILYRLDDTACWETVFNRSYPTPGLGSIQPDSLYYFPTDKDFVLELQEKIQSVLKNKIMDWRARYITRWNRHCTQIMRKLLPILEENCGKSVGEQHITELEQSFSAYKVSGFPINMPFTEMEPIIEQVLATGVHAQESSDVEFALAVYVHPYPNSVLSVWVYVASLMRLR